MTKQTLRIWAFSLLLATLLCGVYVARKDRPRSRVGNIEVAATSITPITNVAAGSSGILFAGDAYDVTCTVSTDTVTLYAAAHDGSAWRVYDATACTLAVGGGRTCRFPADRQSGLTWNAYKTGSGSVASCTAQQSFGPVTRAPSSGGGGAGTVTSVALTMPTGFSVAGSPITGAGTLAVSLATQTAGYAWLGPISGSPAAPTFRALDVADIPHPYKMWWSPVVRGGINTYAYNAGGDYTVGNKWIPNCRLVVTGCRFYSAAVGSPTVRCKLWGPAVGHLASVDVATTSAGIYTATFATPVTIALADVGQAHYSSIYQTNAAGWTEAGTDTAYEPTPNALWGPHIQWLSSYQYAGGDAKPMSAYGGSYLPMEPTFATKWPDC